MKGTSMDDFFSRALLWTQPRLKRCVLTIVPGLLIMAMSPGLHAQTPWPAKPVRMIVTQAAGGTPDIMARLIAEPLAKGLGQPLVVENRGGADNILGAMAVAKAPADGYTLMFGTGAVFAINPHTFKSMPYDPLKDFAPVAVIGHTPFMLVAHPSLPVRTLADIIAMDRAAPGKLSIATNTPRTLPHIVVAWLNRAAGMRMEQIPYPVMTQGMQDTVAGRTQLAILAVTTGSQFTQRGALRAIATTSAQRLPGMEDVPAIAETIPGFDLNGWFALAAPAGSPSEAILRVNQETTRILKEPDILRRLRELGLYADGGRNPQAVGDFFRSELNNWGRVLREIGVQAE
jgi:tripartite-type tricarboxylate transporter receptor subunit TctC